MSPTYRRRWWTLVALSISLLIIIVDDTIINVALPTLQRELGASAAALQWIVDSYILAFAGLLLTTGSLGDRFGRKRVLQLGLVLFALASAYAATATSTTQLIVARTLMGVGGALIMPSTLSVIVDVFPRDERVKAIGIWTGVASLGIPLGPIAGGWLLEQFWWGSVFLLNLPTAFTALATGWVLVPESRDPNPKRLDLPGLLLSIVSVSTLVYAIIEAPVRGSTSIVVIGSLVAAIVSGAVFVVHEQNVRQPMIDLRVFQNPRLAWGTLAVAVAAVGLGGLAFDLTQYLQFIDGYTPLQAGLRFFPLAIGFGIGGPVSQNLVRRLGSARTVALGLGAVAVLLGVIGHLQPGISYWYLGAAMFLTGFGIGTAFVPATDVVMAAVPEANASLGSAINDTGRQVGAALGIAVLGALTNAGYSTAMAGSVSWLDADLAAVAARSIGGAQQLAVQVGGLEGEALQQAALAAFTDGFRLAMLAAAALLVLGAVLVLRHLPPSDAGVYDGTPPRARPSSVAADHDGFGS